MSRLFPFRSSEDRTPEPRLLELDEEAANDIFDALSSETARLMLHSLYTEPQTASELADHADTSLQNVRYHLNKFEAAGLIEPAGEAYSEQGNEMTVYAPTYDPLIVAARSEERTQSLQRVLKQLLGAVGVLAVLSVIIDQLLRRGLPILGEDGGSSGGGAGGEPTPTPTQPPEFLPELPPGVLVFIIGLLVLVGVGTWVWYQSQTEPPV